MARLPRPTWLSRSTRLSRPAWLPHGERVLAAEMDATGTTAVATTMAIYLLAAPPATPSGNGWQRLGWAETGRVSWDPHRHLLDLTGMTPAPFHLFLDLAPHSRLAALCAERVRATLLASTRITLRDGTQAEIQARRTPSSGDITWLVVLDGPTDAADPDLREHVSAAIRALRTELALA